MAILGVLEAKVKADTKQFDSALDKSKKGAKEFGTTTDKHIKKATMVFKGMGVAAGIAATAVVAGAFAAGVAMNVLNSVIQATVPLAMAQEDAEIKLAGVLRATGKAAGFSLGELKKYASHLQDITTVGDETTIAGMSILATFKEIKGDQFKEATKAAIDMSVVMGTDLKSSIVQVAKALNDPIKGMSALSESGVSFTEAQKAQVKALQESGDMMGAQKVILAELKGEFGAVAEALRGNFEGRLDSVKGRFSDLKEEIGFTITKNNFFLESLAVAEGMFTTWTKSIQENRGEWMELAKSIGLGFVDAIGLANRVVRSFYGAWKGLVLVAHGAVALINKGLISIVETTRQVMFKFDLLFTALEKVGAIDKNPFDSVMDGMKGFDDVSGEALTSFKKVWDEMEAGKAKFDKVGAAIDAFKKKIKAIEAVEVDPAANISKEKVKTELKEIGGVWVNVAKESGKKVTDGNKIVYDGMRDEFLKAVKQMEEDTKNGVNNMIAHINRLRETKVDIDVSVDGHAKGGPIGAFATGGKLPGYGGGDKNLSLLEDGEFVIRKEAVSMFGEGIFSALNNFQLPKFATGGPVGASSPESMGHFTHDINFQGAPAPVRVTTDRQNAEALVRELQRMGSIAA